MSKRGREKKALHVAKVTEKREARRKEQEARGQRQDPAAKRDGKKALGMAPPWKRQILEALKKRRKI
jgi:hypothetical protein